MRLTLIFSFLFMVAGSACYFIGFRIAIKIKPAIAQSLGGVVTLEEQREIEDQYRNKLNQLQTHLTSVEDLVANLRDEKDRLAKIATPSVLASKVVSASGAGGPLLLPINSIKKNDANLFNNLDGVIKHLKNLESSIEHTGHQWNREINLLRYIPTSPPINVAAQSNYGNRIDPINGKLAFHSGIDFPASPGTKVVAAGDGKIIKVSSDSGYGFFIEIKHALGITSKYSHLSKTLVQEGDAIHRGQVIGQVGSSGRSTGPNLHYEIIEERSFKNPSDFIITSRHLNRSINLD
jgi:murein DD-endopeptidase MepM/ murein hydrolase activator NlpD